MTAACTENEFIELWNTLRSASKVAQALGVSQRSTNLRRRKIERRRGVQLLCSAQQAQHYTHLQTAHHHPQRVPLGIEDGVVLVFSDSHFWPGIRTTAYDGLIWAIREFRPKAVIANGDCFDGASISRHPRIGWDNKPAVLEELKACEIALGEIEDEAKRVRDNVKLVWPCGNHDARLESRLAANAPEFQGVKGFTLKDHFPAWTPCWSCWPTEDVVVKHRFKGGVHATHNNTVASGKSMVTGHLHSLKVTPYTDYGPTRFGVDTGTLAEPCGPQFIDYMEDNPASWRSGFAILTFWRGRLLWPEVAASFAPSLIQLRGQVVDVSGVRK